MCLIVDIRVRTLPIDEVEANKARIEMYRINRDIKRSKKTND